MDVYNTASVHTVITKRQATKKQKYISKETYLQRPNSIAVGSLVPRHPVRN